MDQGFIDLAKVLKPLPIKDFHALLKGKSLKETQALIRAKGLYDLKFFSKFFFSEMRDDEWTGHAKDPFNKMHLSLFKTYDPFKRDIKKVILASRGSAKTTLIGVFYTLHRICYGLEKYILILSATTPLARGKSADIHTEVRMNEKLQDIFNIDFIGKRAASKESFVLRSMYGDCKVHSQGFFSQIRGTKYKDSRVTLFLFDDVVHGEEVFSEDQRVKAERQFKTDIMNASQPGSNFFYIGTRIHIDDLGSLLSRDPAWESDEYPAFEKWPSRMDLWDQWEDIRKDPTQTTPQKEILSQKFYEKHKKQMEKGAKVLWPEREPTLELMKQRFTIGRREFGAEKQMQAYLSGDKVFEKIVYFQKKEVNGIEGYYLPEYDKFIEFQAHRFVMYYAIDPATGEQKKQTQKKTLSQSARIMAAQDTETGNLFILDAFLDRKPPSRIIYEMYDLFHHYDFRKMFFEENLFKDVYAPYIRAVGKEWNDKHKTDIALPIHSIYNKIAKEQRIYGIEPYVTMGKIIVNEHINPDFLTQLHTYPNSDHNDGLDALQLLWQGLNNKGFRVIR